MKAVLQRKKMNYKSQFKHSSIPEGDPDLISYQPNCCNANLCFLCEIEGIKYKNWDCGCELWCEGCAAWVRKVQMPPYICIICRKKVTGWQVTERYIDQTLGFTKSLLSHRQHFEAAQIAAEFKKGAAVEEAVASMMQDMQRRLDLSWNEMKEAEKTNRNLVKKQEILTKVINAREERLRVKDQEILDLQEQVSDLKGNLQARSKIVAKGAIEGSAYVAPRGNLTRRTRRRR